MKFMDILKTLFSDLQASDNITYWQKLLSFLSYLNDRYNVG